MSSSSGELNFVMIICEVDEDEGTYSNLGSNAGKATGRIPVHIGPAQQQHPNSKTWLGGRGLTPAELLGGSSGGAGFC
ncbi:MAG TPA: hypothetical protein VH596_00085 [Terriglobales bacterium]